MIEVGHEQGGEKSPPVPLCEGFTRDQAPVFGEVFARGRNCFVEWEEDGTQYACLLPTGRALDALDALVSMRDGGGDEKAPKVDRVEIWPAGRQINEANMKRLWAGVNRTRQDWKMWSIEFARHGYEGGFER